MDAYSKKTALVWLGVVMAIGLMVYWQYREFFGAGDKKLRQQIVGVWKVGGNATTSNGADGTFVTIIPDRDTNSSGELKFEGTWDVKNGFLISVLTNVINSTHMKHVKIGSVDRMKIIKWDDLHLSLKMSPYTNESFVSTNEQVIILERQ